MTGQQPDRQHRAQSIERGSAGIDIASLLARVDPNTGADAPVATPTQWDVESLSAALTSIASRFAPASIDAESDLFDSGATSVGAVEFIAAVDRELRVPLNLDDVFADARPRRLAERWLSTQGPADDFQQLMADVSTADRLPFVDPPAPVVPRRILLTGSTGFLGSHLLLDLLRYSDAQVVCLVRAADEPAALDRLATALAQFQLPWSAEVRRRIAVLPGDLRLPRLGLAEQRWTDLGDEVDSIVNAAAAVDFLRGYQSLRATNVLGLLTLTQLAASGRPKPLHHVSSIAVFNELGIASMGEDDPVANIGKVSIGYDRTKWAAEAVLRRAREHGLVATILRPGGIGGHQETGAHNPRDLNSGIIAAFSRFRTVPGLRHLTVAPVDWVSRVSAAIVTTPDAWGRNYHLTGTPSTLSQLVGEASLGGVEVRVQHWADWCDEVVRRIRTEPVPELESLAQVLQSPVARAPLETMASAPAATDDRTRAFVRAHHLPTPVRYGPQAQSRTLELLARTGLARLPQPDDPPFLWFPETLVGTVGPVGGLADVPCTLNLTLSIASTYQLTTGRTVDIRGELLCAQIHTEPLQVHGQLTVRPHEGIPMRHGTQHPLMHYRCTLRDTTGGTWWLEGHKVAAARRDLVRQSRTLAVSIGRAGGTAEFAGSVAVPVESYLEQQIDGIQVDPRLTERQRRTAKLLWLTWFGLQVGKGLLEPSLRVGIDLLDLRRAATTEEPL